MATDRKRDGSASPAASAIVPPINSPIRCTRSPPNAVSATSATSAIISSMLQAWLSGGTADRPHPRMSKRTTGCRVAMIGIHSSKISRLVPTP